MKTRNFLAVVLLGMALAISVRTAAAKQAPSPTPAAQTAPTPNAERPIPFYGKIATVDPATKSFTLAAKKGTGRILKVMDKTVLTKGGNPATFADVTKEEEVRGSYWKKADGSLEAKSVKLGPPTAAEQAAKAAKTAKPTP